ncbi:class I SAM-dependent methyltransferase [Patescibacteria group bacterium]|nr:class I SAM-dependent methyltransferase [Patescibacteria group bacterium]MBU0964651.1 class I SAM-dependent methyltransferase [Patescibacteria group bacterium]
MENNYNPIISVRRDFDLENIFYNLATNEAVIKDPDLKKIYSYLRTEVVPGSLLSLGAGPTHLHYVIPVIDLITCVTALDLSKKNIEVIKEFFRYIGSLKKSEEFKSDIIKNTDIQILQCLADFYCKIKKRGSGKGLLLKLLEKSQYHDKADLIIGDMHDFSLMGERKFNNILLGFSLYVNSEDQLLKFFQHAKGHLNPGGKILLIDFDKFSNDDINGEFLEDDDVIRKCPDSLDFSLEMLLNVLGQVGFKEKNISTKTIPVLTDGLEKERGYEYFFATIKN